MRARVKPVPQTKRMKTKYTAEKCSLTAKLIREGAPEDRERSESHSDEEPVPSKKQKRSEHVSDEEDDEDWQS